ncbi:MAG TPA: NDP-sugar synthase [Acidobacteriota bacterium]|jgi:mannose-1-phosphate guanylyltransferase/mannose-1-phosphate guanylyltransferase/phosphomannomutase
MKSMVLAAGFGTRLLPLTLCRAKPAMPYHSLPILCYCLRKLEQAGVREAFVNLHHLADTVRRAAGQAHVPQLKIRFSFEPEILGTAGALNQVRPELASEDQFLLINGKIVFDFDLEPAIRHHRETRALATLVMVDPIPGEAFNPVYVDSTGRVNGFGRTTDENAFTGLIFTGIHILDRRIWEYVPSPGFSDMVRDVYTRALDCGELIACYHARGTWLEFSTLARYWRLNVKSGGNWIGDVSKIASSARVSDSVVWDGVRIGDACRIENCVIGDGVVIPEGAAFKNSAIVPADSAAPRFEKYLDSGLIVYPLGNILD